MLEEAKTISIKTKVKVVVIGNDTNSEADYIKSNLSKNTELLEINTNVINNDEIQNSIKSYDVVYFLTDWTLNSNLEIVKAINNIANELNILTIGFIKNENIKTIIGNSDFKPDIFITAGNKSVFTNNQAEILERDAILKSIKIIIENFEPLKELANANSTQILKFETITINSKDVISETLNTISIPKDINNLILNVSGGKSLNIMDVIQVAEIFTSKLPKDTNVGFSTICDESLNEKISVSIML